MASSELERREQVAAGIEAVGGALAAMQSELNEGQPGWVLDNALGAVEAEVRFLRLHVLKLDEEKSNG